MAVKWNIWPKINFHKCTCRPQIVLLLYSGYWHLRLDTGSAESVLGE